MDAVCTNDRIKRFERLGCKYHSWSIAAYVIFKMEKVVELWFVEPLGSPCCGACQEEGDFCVQVFLKPDIRYLHERKFTKVLHTMYLSISGICGCQISGMSFDNATHVS